MANVGYYWYSVKLWFWERPEKISRFVAFKLPRRVALWAFVRVYGFSHDAPGPEYIRACTFWDTKPITKVNR